MITAELAGKGRMGITGEKAKRDEDIIPTFPSPQSISKIRYCMQTVDIFLP